MAEPGTPRASLGGVLLGGLVCCLLSGIVSMQTVLYFRLFPKDHWRQKLLVSTVSFLDLFHTVLVCASEWLYLIESFGDVTITDHVFWTVGATIALTAINTVIVHFFFAYRLHMLSMRNFYLTGAILGLAILRLTSAFVTSGKLIQLGHFSVFYNEISWIFTLGLSLTAAIDCLIMGGLIMYLRSKRSSNDKLSRIMDRIIQYTVENGLLTCIVAILAMIFWLVDPHHLIYLGVHFALSKLYANSFLASMNSRKLLIAHSNTTTSERATSMPVFIVNNMPRRGGGGSTGGNVNATNDKRSSAFPNEHGAFAESKMQITIDRTMEIDDDSQRPAIRSPKSPIQTEF